MTRTNAESPNDPMDFAPQGRFKKQQTTKVKGT
jgi:hypothetical protein